MEYIQYLTRGKISDINFSETWNRFDNFFCILNIFIFCQFFAKLQHNVKKKRKYEPNFYDST